LSNLCCSSLYGYEKLEPITNGNIVGICPRIEQGKMK
jgi:hypothetical protein